jgi:hypothetical protein
MRTICTILLSLIACVITAQSAIQSPYTYFKYYGKHHTPHHRVIEYLKYVDENSDRITMSSYGESNQGRPLHTIFISSSANLAQKEIIRQTNLYNIGMSKSKPEVLIEKAIVWCSFGVHGNEAGTTESVMNIVYTLATASDASTISYLENAMVVIDPSLNPDGYDRYTHFLRSVTGDQMHPSLSDREHMEPWPTGRYNHYLFDLNRDWAWQTQIESQQRNAVYNSWMPHIHADFHEMGANSNYYFAPAAEPYHEYITPFQRDFQTRIGRNHASYFDKKGWLYFTRETFDLLYPSYGDTYPTYNGAIGMTYEQAGNSSSGRSIQLRNGDTLTINDKIIHNTVVALSTIEVGAKNAQELVSNFKKYFADNANTPKGKYKTYVIKGSQANQRLATLLKRHDIVFGYATDKKSLGNAYAIGAKSSTNINIEPNDIIIQAHQPKSVMLQILMEEEPTLQDSVTYDITAWSVPMAYGSQCYGFTSAQKIDVSEYEIGELKQFRCPEETVSYVIAWDDLSKAKYLSKLHQAGIKVRMAMKSTSFDGQMVNKGSLVINRGDNPRIKNLKTKVTSITGADCLCLQSGFSDKIGDMGGSYFGLLTAPKVLSIAGEGVNETGAGEVWHYFDKTLQYPVSVVNWENFGQIDLSTYNTLILPEGYYGVASHAEDIAQWVSKGGRLIAIGSTISSIETDGTLGIEQYTTETEKTAASEADSLAKLANRSMAYDGLERRYISKTTAGAVIKNNVDDTHPLGFGLGKTYYSLKTGNRYYPLQKGQWNVITIPSNYQSAGFIGTGLRKKFDNTVSFCAKNVGTGQIVYMVDNPLYRGFWDKGLLLFANAVFLNGRQDDNY